MINITGMKKTAEKDRRTTFEQMFFGVASTPTSANATDRST